MDHWAFPTAPQPVPHVPHETQHPALSSSPPARIKPQTYFLRVSPLQMPVWELSSSLPEVTPGWFTVRRGRRQQRQQRWQRGDSRRGDRIWRSQNLSPGLTPQPRSGETAFLTTPLLREPLSPKPAEPLLFSYFKNGQRKHRSKSS